MADGSVISAIRPRLWALAMLMVAPDISVRAPDEVTLWKGYLWAAASSMIVSLVAALLQAPVNHANIVMPYLLAVVLVAIKFGGVPAMATAIFNVLAFDFFFVPPRLSFAVDDAQYLVTFGVMMFVGLVLGQLTAAMRMHARQARSRERQALIHFEMAKALNVASSEDEALEIGSHAVRDAFRVGTLVLRPGAEQRLALPDGHHSPFPGLDLERAQRVFEVGTAAEEDASAASAHALLYLPMRASTRNCGVLVAGPLSRKSLGRPAQRQLFYSLATQMASAAERLHLLSVAHDAQVAIESERLRNSILAALSHDLRTPLTALIGMSEDHCLELAREGSSQTGPAGAITERLLGMSELVSALLGKVRFQAGIFALRMEWQSLPEIAESAARSVADALLAHPLHLRLPETLPLIYGDGVLLARVLANLLENAAKYTPQGTPIALTAWQNREQIVVEVSDEGPGLPGIDSEMLFRKFKRGEVEFSATESGMGLSICRAIVRAHGGVFYARNRRAPSHGAVLTWAIPFRQPPSVDELATPAIR